MSEIKYITGDQHLLDRIHPLWEKLNQHHQSTSTHFADGFANFSFEIRKVYLLEEAAKGALQIDIAIDDTGKDVGYCISTAIPRGKGELESIYVENDCRQLGIGRKLVGRAMAWFKKFDLNEIIVEVAYGNEQAFSFYEEFGFYPRKTVLKQKRQV
jgi:diamine N-acetyltransferase